MKLPSLSASLSVRQRPLLGWLKRAALLMALVAIGYGANFLFWRSHLKRFQVVRPGMFYRVAQPSEFGLQYLTRECGLKTLVSVQLYDFRLAKGLFDPGDSDGAKESIYAADLGIQHLQWPMGDEQYWPWVTPWQYEAFFALLDDPNNWPVGVHCMGGRHRTGTLSALFRLEYDRWPVERALAEMHDFNFGPPVAVQEHNLRTYLPRPIPTAQEWKSLAVAFDAPDAHDSLAAKYAALVRSLKLQKDQPETQAKLVSYLSGERPFALPLAQRLIASPNEPLAGLATDRAAVCLQAAHRTFTDWAMSASLIADFGQPAEQQFLFNIIGNGAGEPTVSDLYQAVVAGVTNRYTPNRVPYLRALLEDDRQRPEPSARKYRYCETATMRLASIVNVNPVYAAASPTREQWDVARQQSWDWFTAHPEDCKLTTLRPATGENMVRRGEGPREEDVKFQR